MISLFSNIAVDIKIHVTAPMANSGAAAAEEDHRRPPVPPPEMPAFRKTGVAMMRPPLQETVLAVVERQQSEMASTHLTKFATKFRKRSNTR